MSQTGKAFSESWHRVSGLHVSLRSTVRMAKQYFRGEEWFVLQDPFNNQFFRLRPEAREFVVRLRRDRTIEQVWEEVAELNPDGAPGQEDVIQLLSQLYYANLLYCDLPPDSAKLFERYHKRLKKELRSRLLSIMFIRIPLFDPENMLKQIRPLINLLISPLGLAIWLLVVGTAFKLVLDNFDAAMEQAQGVLSPDNLFLLYLGLVLVKTMHEFGHALVCKRFGGEVHTIGVMLLVFSPLPYMDATSSWSFREPWKRALVGGAGMLVEIFVAGLAVFVWANTGHGTIHSLAYNIMFIASVSTVLFNGNPLLRFDGYYILSDLLDIPNLSSRAMLQLRHLCEKYLFGWRDSTGSGRNQQEAVWLVVFGVLSGIYRVVVFTGIILFVADKFLLAGMLMALFCVFAWGVVPLYRFVVYLASNPRLARTRPRAVTVSLSLAAALVLLLALIPFPNRFRSPGVLEASQYQMVINDVSGYFDAMIAPSGTVVEKGAPLLKLSNQELEFEITAAEAQLQETKARQQNAMQRQAADLEPLSKRLVSIEEKLAELYEQRQALVVRARQAGTWVAPDSRELVGTWIQRGTAIGEIVDHSSFRFSAVVSQDEAANLFLEQIRFAEVRIYGQAAMNLNVRDYKIIPYQQEKLPSAALGWLAGGEVPVSVTDKSGLKTSQPFFQIYADIIDNPRVALLHGRSGKIRLTMEPVPLLWQGSRKLRQMLQKRYRI